jgi:hypothetical protein
MIIALIFNIINDNDKMRLTKLFNKLVNVNA